MRKIEDLENIAFNAIERKLGTFDRLMVDNYRTAYKKAASDLLELMQKIPDDENKLAYARKYGRLDNLLQAIAKSFKSLTGQDITLTEKATTMAVTEGYQRSLWAWDQATGAKLGINKVLPESAIRAAVFSESTGLDFIKTMQNNNIKNGVKIQSAITQGLILGESYEKMAKRVEALFNNHFNDAFRVMRTEAGRCLSLGQLAAEERAKKAGIETKKRWSAALDDRARPEHNELDGTYADENGLFWLYDNQSRSRVSAPAPRLFGVPGQDINCRCRLVSELVEAPEGKEKYQTFDDWL